MSGSFATSSPTDFTSAELPPTITWNRPGSTTRFMSGPWYESCSGPSSKVTVRFSPGLSVMRRKPFNSITGRVARLTSARM